jgi:hypothetical protein
MQHQLGDFGGSGKPTPVADTAFDSTILFLQIEIHITSRGFNQLMVGHLNGQRRCEDTEQSSGLWRVEGHRCPQCDKRIAGDGIAVSQGSAFPHPKTSC